MNYYNEIDKSAANWIRQLIKDGLIPPGDVDERSIVDVKPEELKSYVQCHFFAGIAGWSYALQLAGWPANRPVFTGSCPCQPFSAAGKGLGQSDERHLWPAFFNLIRECRPQQVFGEQVASAIGHGWLDGVSADLESEGYACGATVFGAHSVGAPHIRQRLYWVANANGQQVITANAGGLYAEPVGGGATGGLADSIRTRLEGHGGDERNGQEPGRLDTLSAGSVTEGGAVGRMAISNKLNGDGAGPCSSNGGRQWQSEELRGVEAAAVRMVNPEGRGLGIIGNEARQGSGGHADGSGESCGVGVADCNGRFEGVASSAPAGHRDTVKSAGFWSDSKWLLCRDGKHRRVPTEPALFPLADGLPYKLARRRSIRPALLKGAGNAIVPQVAAEFVMAFMEVEQMNQKNTIQ